MKRPTNKQLKNRIRLYKFCFFMVGLMSCILMFCGVVGLHYNIVNIWLSGYLSSIAYLILAIICEINIQHSKIILEMRYLNRRK